MPKPVKRREACPVEGAYTMAQAEELLGLRGSGLRRWMNRHGIRPRRVGKYRIITPEQLARYERLTDRPGVERAPGRPRGWVGIDRAAELGGVSPSFILKWAARGHIEAVRVGHRNYYNPETVKACAAELRQPAPFGWVPLVEFCGGADVMSAAQWLQAQGYPVRKYMQPVSKQRVLHARLTALQTWREHYQTHNRGRKLTLDDARMIRQRRAAGEKRCVLAQEYGVSEAAIYQIMQGKTYPEAAQAAD